MPCALLVTENSLLPSALWIQFYKYHYGLKVAFEETQLCANFLPD